MLVRFGHCLVSGLSAAGVLPSAAPTPFCSAKTFNSPILVATCVSRSRCLLSNSFHQQVERSVERVRASSSSPAVKIGSSMIPAPFEAFVFLRTEGLLASASSVAFLFKGSGMTSTESLPWLYCCSPSAPCSSSPPASPSPGCSLIVYCEVSCSELCAAGSSPSGGGWLGPGPRPGEDGTPKSS